MPEWLSVAQGNTCLLVEMSFGFSCWAEPSVSCDSSLPVDCLVKKIEM